MEQYIDKDALIAEIERRLKKYAALDVGNSEELEAIYGAKCKALIDILKFLDTLEVKEVDLESTIDTYINSHYSEGCDRGMISDTNRDIGGVTYFDLMSIAKHFFKLGLKTNQENNVIGILEREVKIDAGGYPYLDCDGIEFYDYDKDIPLAKEGDKVKVIIVKDET